MVLKKLERGWNSALNLSSLFSRFISKFRDWVEIQNLNYKFYVKRYNNIGKDGTKGLGDGLKGCTNLKSLEIQLGEYLIC